jgi:hypothetical protein
MSSTWNFGTLINFVYPYLAIEPKGFQNISGPRNRGVLNNYQTTYIELDLYCLDTIDKNETNYIEILSDTMGILNSIVGELTQNPFYNQQGINLVKQSRATRIFEGEKLFPNANGWKLTLTLELPMVYNTTNSPIQPRINSL